MTAEEIRHLLNKARHAIFTGEPLPHAWAPSTQEEYIAIYEERTERNPLVEKKLFSEAMVDILPLYQKNWREMNQAAAIMTGESAAEPKDTDEWLIEIYDEMINTETEDEWNAFVKRFE
ncbi:hypothetical protein [Aneurinibacillus terranovensis]|uniref:hypothetical protein n=1 Tax=Aneurinibacillus terranovensis TaxID=278991 RepID=UPI000402DB75|nr:hypothetical protein [Aneurinibacillus terranovensis]